MLLHRVAFRISYACSVVFMIMRFPLRVLAIGGVEAGSGKGGRHAWCSLRGLFSPHQLACSAVISVRRNFKEYRRAQAGRLEKSMRSNVRLWQQALWSMEWNTRVWHMEEGRKRRLNIRLFGIGILLGGLALGKRYA